MSAVSTVLRDVLAPSPLARFAWRRRAYVAAGAVIGAGTDISAGLVLRPGRLVIGTGCFLNWSCHLDPGGASITLGDRVSLGPGVQLLAASHEIGPPDHRAAGITSAPVVVEDGCWLGAGVIVLAGVTVSAGCVIAAGAVVTRDTEPHGLYAGVPATRRRDLPH